MRKGIVGNESDLLSSVKEMAAKMRESMGGLFGDDYSFRNFDLPELAFAGAGSTNTTTTNNNNNTTNLGEVSIYVTGSNNQNTDELAQLVADKINDMLDEDNSVFK